MSPAHAAAASTFSTPGVLASPGNTAGKLPGIDTRGEGGWAVAHDPAVLIAAKLDPGLPPPPERLLAALAPPPRPPATIPAFAPPRDCSRWAAAALAGELREVATAPEGRRNHQLNRSAFRLAQLAAGAGLELEQLAAALLQAAIVSGLPAPEASRTIASGLAAGAQFPRTRGGRGAYGT